MGVYMGVHTVFMLPTGALQQPVPVSSASHHLAHWLLWHQHSGNAQPGPRAAHVVQMRASVCACRSAGDTRSALASSSAHLLPVGGVCNGLLGSWVCALVDWLIWVDGCMGCFPLFSVRNYRYYEF